MSIKMIKNNRGVIRAEPCQLSKMGLFTKILNGQKPCTIFAKTSILDVWQDSEYAFDLFDKKTFLNIAR